ncbi:MAG TPA: GNAT family N-acetyltransferase [Symbiobacteriaceae bacterium]|nr:GNAT family N-acetyltransferase [Symbiobacteriaceae bacterium]
MYTYRPALEADYPAIAAIRNSYLHEPVTPELVRLFSERDRARSQHFLHLVAVADDGTVMGEAMMVADPESPSDEWFCALGVLPDHWGKGVGSELYRRAEEFAREGGARLIRQRIEGGHEDGFRFAVRLGFAVERERVESVLNLADWDGARFGKQVASVRATGIRLMSLPSLTGDVLHQIYDLEMETLEETPFYSGHRPAYEVWAQEHTGMLPGEQFVTLALDGERLVGVSTIYFPESPGRGARQGYTAVRRAYRGRGIALALKLVNIKECKSRGVRHIRTQTDPDNGAVQAVNKKLGFREVPGPRILVKHLDTV